MRVLFQKSLAQELFETKVNNSTNEATQTYPITHNVCDDFNTLMMHIN